MINSLLLPGATSEKAPCFRGHVRKLLTPGGELVWMSEVRTPTRHSVLGLSASVAGAIALVIIGVSPGAAVALVQSPVARNAPSFRQAA